MAYGNNRAGRQPRATIRQAGGSTIVFKHPYIAGQLDTSGTGVDEIDISSCCKLDGRYFEATQNQDSARQVVLVDGSVVTITNNLQNGTIRMPIIQTEGTVAAGDFIAACHLIQSVGDSVGGLLIKTDFINGKALTRVYYGVTVQSCPTDVSEGNEVAEYPVALLYSGWIEANTSSVAENKKRIWAVGASNGIEAFYGPYKLQKGSTGLSPMTDSNSGLKGTVVPSDDVKGDSNLNVTDGKTEASVYEGTWDTGVMTSVTKISPQ